MGISYTSVDGIRRYKTTSVMGRDVVALDPPERYSDDPDVDSADPRLSNSRRRLKT
jgi:hypothetical protein